MRWKKVVSGMPYINAVEVATKKSKKLGKAFSKQKK